MVRWLEVSIRTRTHTRGHSPRVLRGVELMRSNFHPASDSDFQLLTSNHWGGTGKTLEVASALERLKHRDFVGIFQVGTNRNSNANTCNAHPKRLQQFR